MKERGGRGNRLQEQKSQENNVPKEQEKPLTLNLSKVAQEGVLGYLLDSLRESADDEMSGFYKDKPKHLERLQEVRKVATILAKTLHVKMEMATALSTGLEELMPKDELQYVATKFPPGRFKTLAQYYLDKLTRQQDPQKH